MMLHFSKIDNVFLCFHPTFLESDLHHGFKGRFFAQETGYESIMRWLKVFNNS